METLTCTYCSCCQVKDFTHSLVCACLLVLTELPESTVVTSRAASGSPRSVCEPPTADTHADRSGHTAGIVHPDVEDELSDMTARHMSIKER